MVEDCVEHGVDSIKNGLDEDLDFPGAESFISHPKRSRKRKVVKDIPTIEPSFIPPLVRRVTKNMARQRDLQNTEGIIPVHQQHTSEQSPIAVDNEDEDARTIGDRLQRSRGSKTKILQLRHLLNHRPNNLIVDILNRLNPMQHQSNLNMTI